MSALKPPHLTHTARGTIAVTESRRGGSWTVLVIRPCQHTQGDARRFESRDGAEAWGEWMLESRPCRTCHEAEMAAMT